MNPNNGGFSGSPAAVAASVRKHTFFQYVAVAVIVLAAYLCFSPFSGVDGGEIIEKLMLFIIGASVSMLVVWAFEKKLTAKRVVVLLMVIGFTLRIGYMLYTPYYIRQHDLGNVGDAGHVDYIYILATKWRLPDSYNFEFYHPPFYYIIAAAVYDIASKFSRDFNVCFNVIKIVPCFASCATLLVSYKIFRGLRLSPKATSLAMTVLAVHPAFIYLAASINNDMLSIFFIALTILYTIRWFYDQNIRNAVYLAIALGLGMMTKLSVVMMAPVIAAVFVYTLYKGIKARKAWYILRKILIFAAISVPLGLWFQVRNFILFGQPFGYVLKLSTAVGQYCGKRSVVSRFLSFPFYSHVFLKPFGDPGTEYNLWTFILKSSLFGEWNFHGMKISAFFLDTVALLLIAESLFAMVYVLFFAKGQKPCFAKYLLGFTWLVQMAFFVSFNIQYPFGCTMDFRYIVVTLLTGAGFLALFRDTSEKKHPAFFRIASTVITVTVALFAVYSVWFYTNI